MATAAVSANDRIPALVVMWPSLPRWMTMLWTQKTEPGF
jgi:hypothetical protein